MNEEKTAVASKENSILKMENESLMLKNHIRASEIECALTEKETLSTELRKEIDRSKMSDTL